jgi:hypothetical protein
MSDAPLAYLNGRFVPFADAGLPLHDAGFVSGATVVDNARTFRHRLFRWPDHLARFHRDCRTCHVPLYATDEQLTATAEELVANNAKLLPPGGELQVVTFATPGPLGFYVGEPANGPPTLGMVTYPLPFARYRPFFTEGATLAMAGFQSSNPIDLLPPVVKHRSRLFWHVAAQTVNDPASQFHRSGAVPVVLNQGAGDTAIGGLLAVAGDIVIGPVSEWVQESISVKVVSELCRGLGLRFEEAPLDLRYFCRPPEPDEGRSFVARVTELLLAGTAFCVTGVREFARDRAVSKAYPWPGPVLRRLLAAWSDLVGVDVEKQFLGERGA